MPKRKRRPPTQISVTRATFDRIKEASQARGIPISHFVSQVIERGLLAVPVVE